MGLVLYDTPAPQIGRITLNDPDSLNAMGEKMAEEFAALVGRLQGEAASLRAIVLTGAGRAFSAGGDLEMLEQKTKLSGEENRLRMHKFYDSFLGILDLNVPLVAAINGHAIGAGLCLACACDIRVASGKAKLGFTFTRLGLHPGMGATYFLPRVVGVPMATELVLTGRVVEADEALRIGLVSRVVEDACADALKVAGEISECGPESVRQVLHSMRMEHRSLNACLEREALSQGINYTNSEFKEGVRAAREKRKPNWASK